MKDYLQRIVNEIDFSQVKDLNNPRFAWNSNRALLNELKEKYPDIIRSSKELLYWALHYNDNDFIESQFCKCGKRKNFFIDHFCYREYCSSRCAKIYNEEKIKQTNLERYGCEYALQNKSIQEKQKKTNLERYGSEWQLQRKEVHEKSRQTNLKKYGAEFVGQAQRAKIKETLEKKYNVSAPSQIKEAKEKIKQTNLEKYGTEQFLESEEAKGRIKKTNLEKYGCENPFGSKEIQEKIKQTNLEKYGVEHIADRHSPVFFKCRSHLKNIENMNSEFIQKHFVENEKIDVRAMRDYFNCNNNTAYVLKRKYFPNIPTKHGYKQTQYEVDSFIESLGEVTTSNARKIIENREIDIYVPSKKIAIEYDGLLWHSFGKSKYEVVNNFNNEAKHRHDHLAKTELCEEQGIHLFHIFENEWIDPNKQEIWKSMLLNALGKSEKIFARKCVIKEVASKESKQFLEENHIQGKAQSKINLGLYFEDELISLMTFGKPRFNKKYDWELIRFCNKKNTSVIGGASKLLKHFIKKYEPKSMISYANRRWSQGKLYENLGFEKTGTTDPNYFYFDTGEKLYNRVSFQKHKLEGILEYFDPELTETENMYANGYRKIYDCGNLVYALESNRKEDLYGT